MMAGPTWIHPDAGGDYISTWVGEIDRAQTSRVLNGEYPFDYSDMLDEDAHPIAPEPQMSTARPE